MSAKVRNVAQGLTPPQAPGAYDQQNEAMFRLAVTQADGQNVKRNDGSYAPVGAGVAAGGLTGQVLAKTGATDYDTGWIALATVARSGAFTDLVSHPTTLAGYGVGDTRKSVTSLSDAVSVAPTISSPTASVIVERYSSSAPAAPAAYVRVSSAPSHTLAFQDASGQWWEIAEREIDVRFAGAMVDGATNDATAVSRARICARALNRPTFFPAGTTKVTTAWSGSTDGVHTNERFRGNSSYAVSIILFSGVAGVCTTTADPTNFTDNVTFDDLAIHGDNSVTTIGTYMPSWRTSSFRNVEWNFFTTNCLKSYGQRTALGGLAPGDSTYNIFLNCRFLGGAVPVYLTGTVGTARINGGTSNMFTFIGGRAASGTGSAGVFIEQGSAHRFLGFAVVSNAGDGFLSRWYGSTFSGCVSENNAGYGFNFDSVTYAECHDNFVLGQHNGGSNTSGFATDPGVTNHINAYGTGLKLGLGATGSVMTGGLFPLSGHIDYRHRLADVNVTRRWLCRLRKTSPQTISAATLTAVIWDVVDTDIGAGINLGTSATTFSMPETGWVDFGASLEYAASSTGIREVTIVLGGIIIAHGVQNGAASGVSIVTAWAGCKHVNAGDSLVINAKQSSGGDLVLNNGNNISAWFKYVG